MNSLASLGVIATESPTRWTTSKVLTTMRRAWKWPDPPVRFHDFRGLINDQMAALGVPSELRSRTLHHTGDLKQLVNTVYSAYDRGHGSGEDAQAPEDVVHVA